MGAVDVKTEIQIACPSATVAEYASNPDNAMKWYVNIKSVEWITSRPLEIGSKVAFKAKFMGRQLAYVYQIMEWEPGNKLVMSTADGPFPMETTYRWTSTEDGITIMTLRNRGLPTGFSSFFAPFMASMMRRANNKDLKLLKSILEVAQ